MEQYPVLLSQHTLLTNIPGWGMHTSGCEGACCLTRADQQVLGNPGAGVQ